MYEYTIYVIHIHLTGLMDAAQNILIIMFVQSASTHTLRKMYMCQTHMSH